MYADISGVTEFNDVGSGCCIQGQWDGALAAITDLGRGAIQTYRERQVLKRGRSLNELQQMYTPAPVAKVMAPNAVGSGISGKMLLLGAAAVGAFLYFRR